MGKVSMKVEEITFKDKITNNTYSMLCMCETIKPYDSKSISRDTTMYVYNINDTIKPSIIKRANIWERITGYFKFLFKSRKLRKENKYVLSRLEDTDPKDIILTILGNELYVTYVIGRDKQGFKGVSVKQGKFTRELKKVLG